MSVTGNGNSASDVIQNVLGADRELGPDFVASCIPDLLLRIDRVSAICGLSVPTIYRLISKGEFPRPLKITNSARAWKLSQIMAWIDSREREQP